MENKMEIFMDSGAYSAFTRNEKINIYEYCEFIKRHSNWISHYCVLDDINNPIETYTNQKIMEGEGLSPIPCYHYGESVQWLRRYIEEKNDYIALGGMVPVSLKNLKPWLDCLFTQELCNKEGMPIVKVHGFGMTMISLMIRYPWYSVDSTSWVLSGRLGGLFFPKLFMNGSVDYLQPHKINFSRKGQGDKNKHLYTMSLTEQKIIKCFVVKKGFTIDELMYDYCARDRWNIEFYNSLEDALPTWPWKFKLKNVTRRLW